MTEDPRTVMRRKDRQVDDENWIENFLTRGDYGSVATAIDGQPFIHPRTYAYDPETRAIYMHGAKTGRTHVNLTANDRVCFSVSKMGRLMAHELAMEVSVEFESVVSFGRMSIVDDPEEAAHGLHLLMEKYFAHMRAGEDYVDFTKEDVLSTAVYKIDIESWSGKKHILPEDAPNTFRFRNS